jgi:hypothetical protein
MQNKNPGDPIKYLDDPFCLALHLLQMEQSGMEPQEIKNLVAFHQKSEEMMNFI